MADPSTENGFYRTTTSDVPVTPSRYESSYWLNQVPVMMQVKFLELLRPASLSEGAADAWDLAWLVRFGPIFKEWLLKDAKKNHCLLAERMDRGPGFAQRELRELIDDILDGKDLS